MCIRDSLIEDQINVSNIPNAMEFFNDLGLKLVGIVAIENNDNQGFVMLESKKKKVVRIKKDQKFFQNYLEKLLLLLKWVIKIQI